MDSVKSGRLGAGFGAYGEVYRLAPVVADEAAHWIVDAGITKLFGPNMQIDLEAGRTIGARTSAWYAGAGFAIRFYAEPLLHALRGR